MVELEWLQANDSSWRPLLRLKPYRHLVAVFQRDGKQVKRSLKTTDPELAKRRREVRRQKVERLNSDSAKTKELVDGFEFARDTPRHPCTV